MAERRSGVWTAAAVLILLVGALVIYRQLFGPGLGAEATIVSVDGQVLIVAPSGETTTAISGQTLEVGSSIQTGDDARGVVQIHGDTVVRIDTETEIVIDSIASDTAKFTIGRGRVDADVAEKAGRTVEFGARDTDATVTTEGGQLSVVADGFGSMQVASSTGSALVSAGGETVPLAAGQQVVVNGDAISEVMAVPESLLLKVAWPELPTNATRDRTVRLHGRAAPGSLLDVNGKPVAVDAQGAWITDVELQEGPNTIRVRARDSANEGELTGAVERDTRGPPLQAGKGVWK